MIDAGKIFANITLQNVGARATKLDKFSEGFMSPKPPTIGIGMGN